MKWGKMLSRNKYFASIDKPSTWQKYSGKVKPLFLYPIQHSVISPIHQDVIVQLIFGVTLEQLHELHMNRNIWKFRMIFSKMF